ncbi:hypothetical protein [Phytoactinopolyspora endophytica]|uniref:hypothetical protein n=1 Tax=Phytoactinopolyspora endophytica TaxID=1642495 RepID=UPI00101DA418|nr:hypothetical protein [Phytoactinopolyspora endophytica]
MKKTAVLGLGVIVVAIVAILFAAGRIGPSSNPSDSSPTTPADASQPASTTEPADEWPSDGAKQGVIDAAGLSDPSAVPEEPETDLTVKEDGTVIENRHLTSLQIRAANVTVRNVKITYRGSTWAIRADHERVDNLVIENVELDLGSTDSCAGIWQGAKPITVRDTEITGYNCDAVKAGGGGSLYEGVYIHSMRREDSDIHLDGFQPQGVDGLTIRNSVVEMDTDAGANSAFIATPGKDDEPVRNVLIQEVWFSGGNFIVASTVNKAADACHQVTIDGIAFSREYRYGPLSKNTGGFPDCGTVSRAIFEDTHAPID